MDEHIRGQKCPCPPISANNNHFSPKQCFHAGDAIIGCLEASKVNEIISEQKSHILRPIAMIFYFMVCSFTMSIVEVIVHDKVPGMKNALFRLHRCW